MGCKLAAPLAGPPCQIQLCSLVSAHVSGISNFLADRIEEDAYRLLPRVSGYSRTFKAYDMCSFGLCQFNCMSLHDGVDKSEELLVGFRDAAKRSSLEVALRDANISCWSSGD